MITSLPTARMSLTLLVQLAPSGPFFQCSRSDTRSSAVNCRSDIQDCWSSLGAQKTLSRTVQVISVGVTCQSVISTPFQNLSGIAPISLKSHSPLPRGPYFSKSPIIGVSWISDVYHVRPPFCVRRIGAARLVAGARSQGEGATIDRLTVTHHGVAGSGPPLRRRQTTSPRPARSTSATNRNFLMHSSLRNKWRYIGPVPALRIAQPKRLALRATQWYHTSPAACLPRPQ